MNHVTFETAVRLKEAGYPQPEPKQEQSWYVLFNSSEGPKPFIKFVIDDIRIAGPGPETAQWTSDINSVSGIFAPTATDILRELDENHFLTTLLDGRFCVALFAGAGDHIHHNPAEACAIAWLAIHEKE